MGGLPKTPARDLISIHEMDTNVRVPPTFVIRH